MHEFGIMSAMLEAVEAEARKLRACRVTKVNLVIGDRTGIDDSLRFYFENLSPGTLAEGAEMTMRRTSMNFDCPQCDREYVPVEANFCCPVCGKVGQLKNDGGDMFIESMEIES